MDPYDEIERLKKEIEDKNKTIEDLQRLTQFPKVIYDVSTNLQVSSFPVPDKLTNSNISRYSRQLILPEIGVQGQLLLGSKSVLIVGAGGLGCPAAIYLAAAGIGRLGFVDYDEAEISNLHRQILHREERVGVCKSASAAKACQELNSGVVYVPYHLQLDSSNAIQIISQYDIVLDATDNVASRYLLNDACILAGKPLVSGSALRFEGQLTVYNYKGGPCYRCLYPKPPPPETVTNCSDGGVLGVVPGIIGCLQALEAIKIAMDMESSFSQKLLMFDGLDGTFRAVRLRGRQQNCPVCGDQPTITKLIDYEEFCGAKASDKDKDVHLLQSSQRITVKVYQEMLEKKTPHLLIDVRQPVEFDICKLPTECLMLSDMSSAVDIPIGDVEKEKCIEEIRRKVGALSDGSGDQKLPVVFVCRRGNDSQVAVSKLHKILDSDTVTLKDIAGGLTSWAKQVDPKFPTY